MRKKVLVVDDDDLVLYGLEKALRAGEIEVDTAATAAEAVRLLSTFPYDLCLLDVHLPDFSGMILMKIIKDICPRVRVIIMTASCLDYCGLSETTREALRHGACRFIAKPFDLYEIKEVVIEALHDGQGSGESLPRQNTHGDQRQERRRERSPFTSELAYSLRETGNGSTGHLRLSARALDISDHGVGLLTDYPLRPYQVINFENQALNCAGIVAWSTMIDAQTCRAGVCFR
ncbi:response regulator [Desulfurivibrio sp. D14AmB]|uniref:response regulator n=1 Tax=Desulfurivibrio sp. D14AmB TaxID=3374370 RepID=UPI00376F0EAF